MKNLMNINDVNNKIIVIRNQNVILDSDVAKLYGVETRDINKSVRNNPGKFPEGYVFDLKSIERQELVENFHRFNNLKHSISTKAFTEKGLYMLATILKSPQATQTTIEIVEAFAKLREVASNLAVLNSIEEIEEVEPEVIERTGNIISDLLFSRLPTASAETSFEVNLGVMKMKRSVKSENLTHQSEFEEMKRMMKQIREDLKGLKKTVIK